MEQAVDEGFATVITSGSILTVAGFVIGFRVSDVYVSHIGLAVGRGAAISVCLVMTVLPQFILLCDRLIDKTTFALKAPALEEEAAELGAGNAAVPEGEPAGEDEEQDPEMQAGTAEPEEGDTPAAEEKPDAPEESNTAESEEEA